MTRISVELPSDFFACVFGLVAIDFYFIWKNKLLFWISLISQNRLQSISSFQDWYHFEKKTKNRKKKQFGGRNRLPTVNALARLVSYTQQNQKLNIVASVLAIDIKYALLKSMKKIDLFKAYRSQVYHFFNRRIGLIIYNKILGPMWIDPENLQGSLIIQLLFLIHTSV